MVLQLSVLLLKVAETLTAAARIHNSITIFRENLRSTAKNVKKRKKT